MGPDGTLWSVFLEGLANPSFFSVQFSPFPTDFQPRLTTLEEYCMDQGAIPHALSKLYFLLILPPEYFLEKWESDLHGTFATKQKANIDIELT